MGYESASFYISSDNVRFCEEEAKRIRNEKGHKRYNKSQYLDDLLDKLRVKQEVKKPIKNTEVAKCDDAKQVINMMNLILGTKYSDKTKSHIENINARLKEGNSIDDLIMVVQAKKIEWGNDQKFSQYLRPQTLFQASKFNGYLIAAKNASVNGYSKPNDSILDKSENSNWHMEDLGL